MQDTSFNSMHLPWPITSHKTVYLLWVYELYGSAERFHVPLDVELLRTVTPAGRFEPSQNKNNQDFEPIYKLRALADYPWNFQGRKMFYSRGLCFN